MLGNASRVSCPCRCPVGLLLLLLVLHATGCGTVAVATVTHVGHATLRKICLWCHKSIRIASEMMAMAKAMSTPRRDHASGGKQLDWTELGWLGQLKRIFNLFLTFKRDKKMQGNRETTWQIPWAKPSPFPALSLSFLFSFCLLLRNYAKGGSSVDMCVEWGEGETRVCCFIKHN